LGQEANERTGFTLLELLVVVTIIAILAALLLPVLWRGKAEAMAITCLSNLRQLNLAWTMYTHDYDDKIPPNRGLDTKPDPVYDTWVRGWLDIATAYWPDNTNTAYLRNSLIAPYLGASVAIWRCPADHSQARFFGQLLPRVRSYSMNYYLNSPEGGPADHWKHIRQTVQMVHPSPAETFVFIDEREDSITDCTFGPDMDNPPVFLPRVPRNAHNGRGTVSFADGHEELHRWLDPRTEPPIIPFQFVGFAASLGPPNPDVLWMCERTTERKE